MRGSPTAHILYNARRAPITLDTYSMHDLSTVCCSYSAHDCLSPSSPKSHFYHLTSIEMRVLMGARHTHETSMLACWFKRSRGLHLSHMEEPSIF